MAVDPRDELWNTSFDVWYLAAFNEKLCEHIVDRWKRLDDASKLIIALSASGSAVSGWTLWEDPTYKWVWLILAGLGAILSIVNTSLGISVRLKDWEDARRDFSVLQIDIDTYRSLMRINPEFDIEKFTLCYTESRARYREAIQKLKPDLLKTHKLELRCQNQLDRNIPSN